MSQPKRPLYIAVLYLGTLQTIAMAIYHFFIPYQFQWKDYLQEGVPTINWALFTTNNYFSTILLLLGIMLAYQLWQKSVNVEVLKSFAILLAAFWCFSLIYQLFSPMPLPSRLSWLRWLLVGTAGFNTVLFIFPLWRMRQL